MARLTKPLTRAIIEDFAADIRAQRVDTAKPSKTVINFRSDYIDRYERTVWQVPIGLLRFRKDNGRIASDVLDYQGNIGVLDETDDKTQRILREFLRHKDPEKTVSLRKSIMHGGQREPAIITCDGFLINGNRRKMVIDQLKSDFPEDDRYVFMKVVILPGQDEPGGPPSLVEIEKLENRYQLQSDGKSEYYGFDRALSMKRKIELGLSLEEQLRDDPRYAELTDAKLKDEVSSFEKKYLTPLDCVDRYLRQFGREGQYLTVSAGISDKEGRWQSFVDYSNTLSRYFQSEKKRLEYDIEEEDIGEIEEAAFDIIRLRSLPDLPKAHMIMRNLPKYCRTRDGKREIKKIARKVEPLLLPTECVDESKQPLTREEVDAKWATKNLQDIVYHLKKAVRSHEAQAEKETPLTLLEAAHKKLTHKDMDLSTMAVSDFEKARTLATRIQARANELESKIYQLKKNFKKLTNQGT